MEEGYQYMAQKPYPLGCTEGQKRSIYGKKQPNLSLLFSPHCFTGFCSCINVTLYLMKLSFSLCYTAWALSKKQKPSS